jgi:hypothetical protein
MSRARGLGHQVLGSLPGKIPSQVAEADDVVFHRDLAQGGPRDGGRCSCRASGMPYQPLRARPQNVANGCFIASSGASRPVTLFDSCSHTRADGGRGLGDPISWRRG